MFAVPRCLPLMFPLFHVFPVTSLIPRFASKNHQWIGTNFRASLRINDSFHCTANWVIIVCWLIDNQIQYWLFVGVRCWPAWCRTEAVFDTTSWILQGPCSYECHVFYHPRWVDHCWICSWPDMVEEILMCCREHVTNNGWLLISVFPGCWVWPLQPLYYLMVLMRSCMVVS